MTRPRPLLMLVGSLVLFASTVGCAHEPRGEAGIERWADRHPEASRELGAWVQAHPRAAARLFDWDGHHPERSSEFVTWTLSHPNLGSDAFVALHPGWPAFNVLAVQHRPATEAFMMWCRRRPRAAEALMRHPGGLFWAGHHLYQSYWSMERAG